MALRGERIGNPRGSERAHHLARLERGFEVHLGAVRNAAERWVQLSGGGEHGVAQFFGGETARGKGGVARAGGIFFSEAIAVRVRGAAAIGFARHDDVVEFFEGPPLLDKRGGEPVEELGVRGFLAGAAEIIRVASERLTEMPEPDAIHDGAGGERIFGGRDPRCKRRATAFDGVGHGSFWRDTEGAEHAGRNFFTEGKRIAVGQNAGLFELALGQTRGRHAEWIEDGLQLGGASVVNGEGEGLVAVELPLEAFEAFAGDAFVAVVFGAEAKELGRKFILGHLQPRHRISREAEGALELLALAAALLGARLFDGGVPFLGIECLLFEPFLGRDEHLGVEATECREVVGAARFEVCLLLETGGVFVG